MFNHIKYIFPIFHNIELSKKKIENVNIFTCKSNKLSNSSTSILNINIKDRDRITFNMIDDNIKFTIYNFLSMKSKVYKCSSGNYNNIRCIEDIYDIINRYPENVKGHYASLFNFIINEHALVGNNVNVIFKEDVGSMKCITTKVYTFPSPSFDSILLKQDRYNISIIL
ncbi:Hypothetical protein ORPV_888 [Orpheovirus IHUMI-LCC2]|uniref:Uncharacterized protein n=1 Tax=Orpheovirus IHUMI-LCC2 TaxID=2023057 RepID=A0A2I2L5G8_9VIRU|nr:Hypothetical protein ORPV_888 [Orpheovirus IHUMI-LCC2]SNW62792.1 Hypothetical protein ORPV_888 [Orpheovirus IHUMI-LCC2]